MRPVYAHCAQLLVPTLLIGSPMAAQKPVSPAGSASPDAVAAEAVTRTKVFEEPLVPIGPMPPREESQALAGAIETYLAARRNDAVEPFQTFLEKYPNSSWRASLLLNLGLTYRYTGYFSRAIQAWETAWGASKASKDARGMAVADRAGTELADLDARLGRTSELEVMLKELEKRPLRGSAASRLQAAKEGLGRIRTTPERAFRCGPLSLASLRNAQGKPEPRLLEENSAPSGTSLLYNQKLGQKYQMDLQMAKREPGSGLVLPAVMHWKSGHFAALIKEVNGRYLMQDPTFGDDIWITREAIEDEGSGYALIPSGSLPNGWRSVNAEEGMKVMGRGGAPSGDQDANGKKNNKKGGGCPKGMAVYAFHSLLASLSVTDIPVGYTPSKGPGVEFQVFYSQREANQPQTFTYSNLGPKWTFDFLAYIQDDPTVDTDVNPFSMNVKAYERGGGMSRFSFVSAAPRKPPYQPESGPSKPNREDHSVLVRTDLHTYIRYYPDGRKEYYEHPDGARVYPRKVMLTKVVDRLGATLTIHYDTANRVTRLVDALGRTTTLAYEHPSDSLKITKVTDPFGRFARFEYNAQGQLARIIDVVGIASEFAYGPTSEAADNPVDFMNALTTPYGTTRFYRYEDYDGNWIMAKDPMGGAEKLEFKKHPGVVSSSDSGSAAWLPPGFVYRRPGGSFYWDKRAMAQFPDNRDKAEYTRWIVGTDGEGSIDLPYSIKPAEVQDYATTWFEYVNAPSPGGYAGTLNQPSRIIRSYGNGRFTESRFEYNELGRPTRTIDPLGRQTTFVYDDNKLDLLEVRQTSQGRNELLAKYTYNKQHLPLTVTDASGQTTRMTYNSDGQVTGITNPKTQTVSFTYNPQGQLTDIHGLGGAHTGFTYDPVGRLRTVTNPESETVTTDYDDLDRPVLVTYPDATTERVVYDRLDPVYRKDRGGKWTKMTYNALRQLTEVQDALGRITRMDWCGCGTLDSLTDPMGRTTTWLRDLEGRVTGKLLPDRTSTGYTYDAFGRLIQRIDAKGQITRYDYNEDDTLRQVSYANTAKPVPPISYAYDPAYNRLVSMTDRTGTTRYTYHPVTVPPSLGAGKLATETSPMANSTVAYGYDELGRVVSQSINGSTSTVAFDDLGRVKQVVNPLGTFGYQYEGITGRLQNVSLPNGMNTGFSYYDASGQHRLKEISHTRSDQSVVSKFGYTYDADGQIKTWSQQADVQAPKVYTFAYDAVGQLLEAQLKGPNGDLLHRYVYGYDLAGNRTTTTVDGATTSSDFNDGNQLLRLKKQ